MFILFTLFFPTFLGRSLNDHDEVADTHDLMGEICVKQGSFTAALEHYNTALPIRRKVLTGSLTQRIAEGFQPVPLVTVLLSLERYLARSGCRCISFRDSFG